MEKDNKVLDIIISFVKAVKITNVDWKNNHKMADVRFDNMSAEFNTVSEDVFLKNNRRKQN